MKHPSAWAELAVCLTEALDADALRAALQRVGLLQRHPEDPSLGIAISGGADSVFLALVAWAMLPEWLEHVSLLHFNHRTRGEASDGDEAFVREIADGLGLTVHVGYSERNNDNPASEATLREERLAFFRSSGCGVILQGHQRDDILETMLMRLCRGSGTEGLAAPQPISKLGNVTFLRPLLSFGRDEIRNALLECNVPWREDVSNDTDAYLRNRIRNSVIPALGEATGRDPSIGAALSRDLLAEDAAALSEWLRALFPDGFQGDEILRDRLHSLPVAMQRRALYALLTEQGLVPERDAMARLLEVVTEGATGKMDIGKGLRVCIGRSSLSLEYGEPESSEWPAQAMAVGHTLSLPGGDLACGFIDLDEDLHRQISTGRIDPTTECFLAFDEPFPNDFMVRAWQHGDRMHYLGAPGSRKLQDMFTDAKIPISERSLLPIVCINETILWVPGFPPAHEHKINDRTQKALRLTYKSV